MKANFLSFVFNSDRPVRQCQSRYSFRSKRGGSLLTQSRPTGIVNCSKIAFYLNALCIYRVLMLTILNFLHRQRCYTIDFFDRYGDHIEFIRFKEYYGIPRGHSLSIYARFSGKKRTSMYSSPEKDEDDYIQTRHNDLFFRLQSFSGKT